MAHSEKCKCETCMIVTPFSPPHHEASPVIYGCKNNHHTPYPMVNKCCESCEPLYKEASPKVEELPSTPEVSWESSFLELYNKIHITPNETVLAIEVNGKTFTSKELREYKKTDFIIPFIKSVEQKAYHRGYEWGVADEERRALEEDVLKDLPIVLHKVEQIKQQATLTERNRILGLIDGMLKKADSSTYLYHQGQVKSLEDLKHLINNTQ